MHRNHDKGYTLIEICVAMAVMGIVAAFAVVGTSGLMRSSRLTGATNTFVADVRHARQLATTQRTNFQMVFESGGYSIVRVSPLDTLLRRVAPSGVTCTASGSATFYAWGLTDPVTVTLATADRSNVMQVTANGNVSHAY